MVHSLPRSTRSRIVAFSLLLSMSLPLGNIIKASPNKSLYAGIEGTLLQQSQSQQIRQLVPGKQIEERLVGGESHYYQIALAAGQYIRLVVNQNGIDLVVKVSGPTGKQIADFDSEIRTDGQETVS